MMYKKIIITLLLASTFGTPVSSDPLSLSTFIKESLSTHPTAKATIASYQSARHTAKAITGLEDWNLFLSYTQIQGMQAQGSTTFDPDTQTTAAELSLSRIFAGSGTRFSLGSRYDAAVDIPSFSQAFSFDDVYNMNIDIKITQPLLRNSWGAADKARLKRSALLTDLSLINYQKDLNAFIQVLINDYLAWAQADQLHTLFQAQVERATTQYELLKRQAKRSAAEPIDLVQAAQNLQSKKIQLIEQEKALDAAETMIRSRLPGQKLGKPSLDSFDLETSLETAKTYIQTNSLTDAVLDISYRLQSEVVTEKESAALPDLSLFATQTLGTAKNSSSTLSEDIGENAILTLGISYTQPLGNTQLGSELAADAAKLEQVTQEHLALRRDLDAGIDSLYTAYDHLSRLVIETEKLVKLSDEAAALELKTFNQGRSPSYTLVLNAENAALQNRVQLTSLTIQRRQILSQINAQLDRYRTLYYPPSLIEVTQ